MIQSYKFDFYKMNINSLAKKTLDFVIYRLTELIGLTMIIASIFMLISLLSYSPNDPNFIFSENTDIENLLGFQGSYLSDLLFQSIGLVSILLCITIFFTGVIIIVSKKILLIIDNLFYSILYIILGTLFFEIFYPNSFWLSFNGNGGFIGKFIENSFITSIINLNKNISYYFLIILISIIFLKSINFNINVFINFI